MRKILALLLLLCGLSYAQTATISATITDGNGLAVKNGTYRIEYVPPTGYPGPYTRISDGSTTWTKVFTGSMDGAGTFSQADVTRTDFVAPSGGKYRITICPQDDSGCRQWLSPATGTGSITSSSVSLTSQLSANMGTMAVSAGNDQFKFFPRSYAESEIVGQVCGTWFYDLGVSAPKFWNCNSSSWQQPIITISSVTFLKLNGIYFPATWPGATMENKVENVYADCPSTGCEAYIDAGTYSSITGCLDINTINKPFKLRGAGWGATKLVFTHTGSGICNLLTKNGNDSSNVTIKDMTLDNSNGANTGAAIDQLAGSYFNIENVRITGNWKYGIVLDQTEVSDITSVDVALSFASGAKGIWLVNGAEHTVGSSGGFTNRITIMKSQINMGADDYGIVDDGGSTHAFIGNNFNGGLIGLRIANGQASQIASNEFEGQATAGIQFTSTSVEGNSKGQAFGAKVVSNHIATNAIPGINIASLGSATFDSNLFAVNGTAITTVNNANTVVSIANSNSFPNAIYGGLTATHMVQINDCPVGGTCVNLTKDISILLAGAVFDINSKGSISEDVTNHLNITNTNTNAVNGAGRNINLTAATGAAGALGIGGAVNLIGGNGAASSSFAGGPVSILGGNGGSTNGVGGQVNIQGGNGNGTGNGGDVTIVGGTKGGGATRDGRLELNLSVYNDASGFKHKRVMFTPTSPSIDVDVTWGTAFANSSYTPTCTIYNSFGDSTAFQYIGIDATKVRVRITGTGTHGATDGQVNCIAVHD